MKESTCFMIIWSMCVFSYKVQLSIQAQTQSYGERRKETVCSTEPGTAKEKKRKYQGESWGMLPWKTLKVETKICAIWGILETNLKKSSILKFIRNITFLLSIYIHRSIILIIREKSMLVDFFLTENILFCDLRLFFPQGSLFPQRIPGTVLWLYGTCEFSPISI